MRCFRGQGLLTTIAAVSICAALTPAIGFSAEDYPIQPVPFTAVQAQENFWAQRILAIRNVTVGHAIQQCKESGRIDNFAKAAGKMAGEFKGLPWDDSEVYKIIEGASYALAVAPDEKLNGRLDEMIALIAAAQEPDGYLYTIRKSDSQARLNWSGEKRWEKEPMLSHEFYDAGHLYEAAVAHFRATGKRTLLQVALKNADLICRTFGPGKMQTVSGHEEIEVGLIKLFRVTGDKKYLDTAKFLMDIKGRPETHPLRGDYNQDHKPVIEQDEAVGHAVRAGYLYMAMADIAAIKGDEAYRKASRRIWENIVGKKLYLTGGVGAVAGTEGFGPNYELPNNAYNETCAAIAQAMWNHRMFLLEGDSRYLDVLERTLYNGLLSGVSLRGDLFFYPNPLDADAKVNRTPWFDCCCCPTNVVRFIQSLSGLVYAVEGDNLYVNLYFDGAGEVQLAGSKVKVAQKTRYPWEGAIRLTVDPASPANFTVRLRIPQWSQGQPLPSDLYRYLDTSASPISLKINGQPVKVTIKKGFAVVTRQWSRGDTIDLDIPMPIRRVVTNDAVKPNEGLVALERGPIVFCVEGVDNDGHARNIVIADDANLTAEYQADLLGGVTVIRGKAQQVQKGKDGQIETKVVNFQAVPYFAWNNRGPTEMCVWLARTPAKARVEDPKK